MRRVWLTERLRLEPIGREHADELWLLHQDEGVAAWWAGQWSHDDAARYARRCEEAWLSPGVSKWIAYGRVDGALVGRGGLSRAEVDGAERLEVGWTLRDEFWGRGFATEIGRAGLAFGFDELEADDVVAYTETNNMRSRAVMERLGMGDPREITHQGAAFVLYTIKRVP
jgi:ribosomal-protein-alanine N-acetyltransferase